MSFTTMITPNTKVSYVLVCVWFLVDYGEFAKNSLIKPFNRLN